LGRYQKPEQAGTLNQAKVNAMKKCLLLLCLLGLSLQSPGYTTPENRLYDQLGDQLLQQLYIPPRLIDADSILLEIHFSINEEAQLVATKVTGGDPLLRRFILQQAQQFRTTFDLSSCCNQQFVLPVKIRK
jgi:hypothetical protein